MLTFSGGRWDSPPEHAQWSDQHREERDAIIGTYADVPNWGFKDPRSLLLLGLWREALPNLRFVGTFRHPLLVAASLSRRDKGPIDRWLDLWAAYNEPLLALYAADPFAVVRFDVDEESYRRSLSTVMDWLQLRAPARVAFFEPQLCQHDLPLSRPVSERVGRIYDALTRIALDPAATTLSRLGLIDASG